MKIALLGDAHGDLAALAGAAAAAQAAGANAAIQLGDLGFRAPLLGAGQDFPRLALPVHAICGNHEDHAFLAHACRSGLTRRWAERGLIYQPRASTARFDGCTVGFLGGALHIDRPQEAANRPSPSEIRLAIANFSATRPLLIVTHSCPAGIGIGMRGNNAFAQQLHDHVRRVGIDPGPPDDCGEPGLRELWEALPARPATWVFGHFHYFHEAHIGNTHFVSCAALGEPGPLLIWDSRSHQIERHAPLNR